MAEPMTDAQIEEHLLKQSKEGNMFYVGVAGRPAVSREVAEKSIDEASKFSVRNLLDLLREIENEELTFKHLLDKNSLAIVRGAQTAFKGKDKLGLVVRKDPYVRNVVNIIESVRRSGQLKPEAIRRLDQAIEYLNKGIETTQRQ